MRRASSRGSWRRRRHPDSAALSIVTPLTVSAVGESSSLAASGAADLAILLETAHGNGTLFCCLLYQIQIETVSKRIGFCLQKMETFREQEGVSKMD